MSDSMMTLSIAIAAGGNVKLLANLDRQLIKCKKGFQKLLT